MRIAFFGGSFDPPHAGHLRIALAAADRLQLDRVLFAPVASQPLKREGPCPASYVDRLAMLRLLLAEVRAPNAGRCQPALFEVSELDAPRADDQPNYTYDTLLRLRAQLAPGDKLFMLLGADSFLTMHHWHRSNELLLLADWIVAARPGFSLAALDRALPASIRAAGMLVRSDRCLTQQLMSNDGQTSTLSLMPDLHEDVSATAIRTALAAGAGKPLLPPAESPLLAPSVVTYIRDHGLYR